MYKSHFLKLKLNSMSYRSQIRITQGDGDVNEFIIKVFDDSQEIDYDLVSSATITFLKADGTAVQGDAQVRASDIYYLSGYNELACSGPVDTSLQLFDSEGNRLSTQKFAFEVTRDLVTLTTVQSTTEYPILKVLVDASGWAAAEFPGIVSFFDQAEIDEGTRTSAENARLEEENNREIAEIARDSAESVRIDNEDSREAAEAERQSNELSRITSMDIIEEQFANLSSQHQQDGEVVTARTSNVTGSTYASLGIRMNNTDNQVIVLAGTGGLQAKVNQGEFNSYKDANAEALALKASYTALASEAETRQTQDGLLSSQIAAMKTGTPKGAYATLGDLQAAHPTNDGNLYVVGTPVGYLTSWVDGAWVVSNIEYTASAIAVGSVDRVKLEYRTSVFPERFSEFILNKNIALATLSQFLVTNVGSGTCVFSGGVWHISKTDSTGGGTYIRYIDTIENLGLSIGDTATYLVKLKSNDPSVPITVVCRDASNNTISTVTATVIADNQYRYYILDVPVVVNTTRMMVLYQLIGDSTVSDSYIADFKLIKKGMALEELDAGKVKSETITKDKLSYNTQIYPERLAEFAVNKNIMTTEFENLPVTITGSGAAAYSNGEWHLTKSDNTGNGTYIRYVGTLSSLNLSVGDTVSILVKLRSNTVSTPIIARCRDGSGAEISGGSVSTYPINGDGKYRYYILDLPIATDTSTIIVFYQLSSTTILENTYIADLKIIKKESYLTELANTVATLQNSIITPEVIKKTVGTVGCDYTTIAAAHTDITDASSTKVYELLLKDPSYTELVKTKNYINITGDSGSTLTEITFSNIDSVSEAVIEATEPVLLNTNSTIKNLYVHGKNIRYPIHSDGAPENCICIIINCKAVHEGITAPLGTWASQHGIGCGVKSGQQLIVIDTYAQGGPENGKGFYVHNNVNFSKPAKVVLNNCIFVANDNMPGLRLDSMGSGTNDIAEINNCLISNYIEYSDNAWWSGGVGTQPTNHAEWKLYGGGNEYDEFINGIHYSQEGSAYLYISGDNYKPYKNTSGSTITKGSICCYNASNKNIKAMTNADSKHKFVGVAVTDIANNEVGFVQKKGIVPTLVSTSVSAYDSIGADSTAGQGVIDTTNTLILAMDSGSGTVRCKIL